MSVLIVCHAGIGLGLGHLIRSLVIARALQKELGFTIQLLVQGDPVKIDDLDKFDNIFIKVEQNLASSVLHYVELKLPRLVIFDLYPDLIPANIDLLLWSLRKNQCRVIGVDGLLMHCNSLDLIFIPSFHFCLPENLSTSTPIIFGWDCFLINIRPSSTSWTPGRQVLVLTGGSDTTNLGLTLPNLLNASLPNDVWLHWVTGPYSKNPLWPVGPRFQMTEHIAPSNLDHLISNANYAITVYGVSFFELLYHGIPTIVFEPYDIKLKSELATISAEGLALVARSEEDAIAKLNHLMTDHVNSECMSLLARSKLSVADGSKFTKLVAQLLNSNILQHDAANTLST